MPGRRTILSSKEINEENRRPKINMNEKQHVVMFSGGVGSYCAARRVVEAYCADSVKLLFADTLIEDEDLYRFLNEAATHLGAELCVIKDGRDPWAVFRDERFIGNTRVDICSRVLKRELLDKWVKEHYGPEEVVCYIGVDWTEAHRYDRLAPRKLPYIYKAPMCDDPYISKPEMMAILATDGIRPPRLYDLGFAHNNCGGFCVKAGHATFKRLLEKLPERYAYHEKQEESLRQHIGKDVAIMKDRRGGESRPMTMREFRERLTTEDLQIDLFDIGGCGCDID